MGTDGVRCAEEPGGAKELGNIAHSPSSARPSKRKGREGGTSLSSHTHR